MAEDAVTPRKRRADSAVEGDVAQRRRLFFTVSPAMILASRNPSFDGKTPYGMFH